jgi:hypothetical protein
MGHYACDMRPEWFEKDPPKREPDADQFRVGDVWENSIGTRFTVEHVGGGMAFLVNLKTGRTHRRAWDAIGAHTGRPWVRVSCGA